MIGYAGIDTQNTPYSIGIAKSTRSPKSILGLLGADRFSYFQVMRHLLYQDDPDEWFKAMATGKAIGPVPYNHRQQWSESSSPLRLLFRTEDPHRNGWSLSLGSGQHTGSELVKNGYLPPEQVCVSVLVDWTTAITLLLHADDHGIGTAFDSDGQWIISGYALHAAGVTDSALKPRNDLTAEEARQWKVGTPPSEELAMVAVLRTYAEFLSAELKPFIGKPDCEQRVSNLRDHLAGVVRWLIENGHGEQGFVAAGSSLVN